MSVVAPEKAPAVVPEERFWKRYSPHQEMPLSAVGSFLVHGLVIGLLILLAYLGWLGFRGPTKALDYVPVRIKQPVEMGAAPAEHGADFVKPDPLAEPPQDKPLPSDRDKPQLTPGNLGPAPLELPPGGTVTERPLTGNDGIGIFGANAKTLDGKAPRGKPGPGPTSAGPGPGTTGPGGSGVSGGPLGERQQRTVRWVLTFKTRTGTEYLAQLRGLGAILAIPTGPDGTGYKVVRDLSGRGAPKLLDEDLVRLDRICWKDERAESVRSLMGALHYAGQASHFLALMPRELEDEMYNLERKHKGRREEQIQTTWFEVVPGPRGYKVMVVKQTAR